MARNYKDTGLTELFRHPAFINSLLTEIVAEPWVNLIDFSTMKVEDGVHKDIGQPALFSDLIVSFSCTKKSENIGLSIYLLIEFQSNPEPMSLRLLEYLARVYRKQTQGKKHYNPLHPVVPIVIYNGERPWKEDPCFIMRFTNLPMSLVPYIPDFRYFLLDEGRFDPILLSQLKGATAAFIQLDTLTEPEKADKVSAKIITILHQLWTREPDAARLLSKYIEGLLAHRGIDNPAVTEYINERRRPMFAERLDRALDNKWKEGRKQGKEEGVLEGAIQDKQTILMRQLSRKFEVNNADQELVNSCKDPDKLDAALDVILFASDKGDVLRELEN